MLTKAKFYSKIAVFLAIVVLIVSCKEEQLEVQQLIAVPQNSIETGLENNRVNDSIITVIINPETMQSQSAKVNGFLTPSIYSVTGAAIVSEGTFKNFFLIGTDSQDEVILAGLNFGTSVGTLKFTGVSSYTVSKITSWSSTTIKFKAKSEIYSLPAIAGIEVTTGNGNKATCTIKVISRVSIPSVTDIKGNTDGAGISNGRWTGNPKISLSTWTNKWLNYLIVDCYGYASRSSNPYYWEIQGKNFGGTTGKIEYSGLNFYIDSWTNERIKVRPYAPYTYQGSCGQLKITTSIGTIINYNIIPGISVCLKSRGFGQCTYEPAYQRIKAGLPIPPSAYTYSGSISSSYIPQQYDVLYWDMNGDGNCDHTGIISSYVSKSGSGKSTLYSFIITERNALGNEEVTMQTDAYSPTTNTGILSRGSSKKHALKYYR